MIYALFIFLSEGIVCFLLRQTVGFANNMESLSLAIVLVNIILLSGFLSKYAKNKNEYIILWFALFARIIIMLLDVYAPDIQINIHSGADSLDFHNAAVRLIGNGTLSINNTYVSLLYLIYSMFGPEIVIAEYFNVMLSIWAVVLLKDILYSLPVNQKSRMIGLVIMALGPNYILLSPVTLRESIIIFLLTTSLWYFIKWWNNKNAVYTCFAVGFSILGAMFHSGAIALALAYGIIIIFFDQKRLVFTINFRTIFTGLIVIICFVAICNVLGDSIFGKFQRVNEIMDISHEAQYYSKGGSVYLADQKNDSIPELIMNTPIRILYFILSPVPWLWRGINDILSFLFSTSIYLCAILYLGRALIFGCKNKSLIIMLLIMSLSSAAIFSWGVSNAGTALRHREKFISVYVVMLAVCVNERMLKKGNNYLPNKTD